VTGVVQGGWEFVAAAYIATAVALGAYTVSVFVRLRSESRRDAIASKREARE
jgi:hypothetical protein